MHFLFVIAIAAILFLLQIHYYNKYWSQNLSASVSYNKTNANIGETIILTEQITNQKILPLPVLHVKFSTSRTFLFDDMNNASVSDYYHRNDIFSVMGNQQVTRTLQFRTTCRGYFSTEYINLVATDIFLRNSFATRLDNHTALYVYPMLLRDRHSLTVTHSIIGNLSRKDLYEDPLSFRGIRDYTSGDSMRRINWKATAKNQQLMVNTYFDLQSTEVVLLLNLDTNIIQRDNKLQEYIISVAATLLHHMSLKGFATKLAINLPDSFTGKIPITDLGTGSEHMQSMMQILSRIDLSKKLAPFEEFFDSSYKLFGSQNTDTSYLIVSNYRKDHLLTLFKQKLSQGYNIQFICPEVASLCTPLANIHYWEVNPHEIESFPGK